MLCLSGFELYSRCVPLHRGQFLGSPDIINGPKKAVVVCIQNILCYIESAFGEEIIVRKVNLEY